MRHLLALLAAILLPSAAVAQGTTHTGTTTKLPFGMLGTADAAIATDETIQAIYSLYAGGAKALPNYPLYYFAAQVAVFAPLAGNDTGPCSYERPCLTIQRMNEILAGGHVGIVMDKGVWDAAAEWGTATRILMPSNITACVSPQDVCAFIIPWNRDLTNNINYWILDCTNIIAVAGQGIITDARAVRSGWFHVEGYKIQNCETAETTNMDHITDGGLSGAEGHQLVSLNGWSENVYGSTSNAVTSHEGNSQQVILNLRASTIAAAEPTGGTGVIGWQGGGHILITPFELRSLSTTFVGNDDIILFNSQPTGTEANYAYIQGMKFSHGTANALANGIRAAPTSGWVGGHEIVVVGTHGYGYTAAGGAPVRQIGTANGVTTVWRTFKNAFTGSVSGMWFQNLVGTPPANGHLIEFNSICDNMDENAAATGTFFTISSATDADCTSDFFGNFINLGYDDSEGTDEWHLCNSTNSTLAAAQAAVPLWNLGEDSETVSFAGGNPFGTPGTAVGACTTTGANGCSSNCQTMFNHNFSTTLTSDIYIPRHILGAKIVGVSLNRGALGNIGR